MNLKIEIKKSKTLLWYRDVKTKFYQKRLVDKGKTQRISNSKSCCFVKVGRINITYSVILLWI